MINEDNLSYIVHFWLNGFLHIAFLFTFLTFLYYYIICPLTEDTLQNLIGTTIDEIFNAQFPGKINLTNILNDTLNDTLDNTLNDTLNNRIIENYINYYPLENNDLLNNNNVNDYTLFNNNNNVNDYTLFNNNLNNNTEINKLMDDKLKKIKKNTVSLLLDKIYNNNQYIIDNLIIENSSKNYLINKNNEHIIFYSFLISISLSVVSVLLLISFKYAISDSVNVSRLLIENILTFTFVAIIEYWFFLTYAFKYIPIPASKLINLSIDNIKKLLSKPYKPIDTKNPIKLQQTKIILS